MHNYMCDNMAGCLCFTPPETVGSTALVYLMSFRDNAGLRPATAFCFNIKNYIYKYSLLLEIGYVTSYNSMPNSTHSQTLMIAIRAYNIL